MASFPIGLSLLLIIAVLIFLGLAHRVLDRLYLTDKTAVLVIVAMAIGSFIDIPLGSRASINVGGGLIPILLAGYVLFRAGTTWEWMRALLAAIVTALALYVFNQFMGAEPESMLLDPLYSYPLIAGLIAYLVGRSRRTAFIAATLGVVLLDLGNLIWSWRVGAIGAVAIGGAGAFDTIVIAGVFAVLLAELIGEIRERMQGGPKAEGHDPALLENLRGTSLRAKLQPNPERKPHMQPDEQKKPKTPQGSQEKVHENPENRRD